MAGTEEPTSELVVVDVRRYRNVKKALYASEERFRTLFENIPIGIYRTTEDGRIIDANPAFVSMLGFSSRDELSENHRAGEFYVQPGRRNEILSHLRREGVIHGVETLFRRRDGREIVVRQSITLIREPKGNDFYMEGSVEDITEIRRSQEALRRHTQQLEALNHIIASGHQAASMNEFLLAVLCITLEFSGMDAGGIYLIDEPSRMARLAVERGLLGEFADQVRSGSIDQPPFHRVCVLGEGITWNSDSETNPGIEIAKRGGWSSGSSFPLWAGTRIVGALNLASRRDTVVDSDERVLLELICREAGTIIAKLQVESELKRSEKLFRTIFESIPDMVCTFRRDGDIIRLTNFNQAAIEWSEGYLDQRILDADMEKFWGSDSPYLRIARRLFTGEKIAEDVLYRAVLSGKTGWLKVGSALLDSDTMLVLTTNVTVQHEAQEKLEEYQRQLRQLTLDLSLAAERERRRIAADLHDHVGQKLVLAKMTLQAERNRHGNGRGEIDRTVQLLDETIQETRTLIFDISPPVLYELGFVPALEWLCEQTEAKYDISVVAKERGSVAGLDERITVTLFQIARELLVNVGKHSRARQTQVELNRTDDSVFLTVRDDGVGFDPATLGRIDPKRGFGLFSVRERLTPLGGKLRLESQPGRGTSVTVEIPTIVPGAKP